MGGGGAGGSSSRQVGDRVGNPRGNDHGEGNREGNQDGSRESNRNYGRSTSGHSGAGGRETRLDCSDHSGHSDLDLGSRDSDHDTDHGNHGNDRANDNDGHGRSIGNWDSHLCNRRLDDSGNRGAVADASCQDDGPGGRDGRAEIVAEGRGASVEGAGGGDALKGRTESTDLLVLPYRPPQVGTGDMAARPPSRDPTEAPRSPDCAMDVADGGRERGVVSPSAGGTAERASDVSLGGREACAGAATWGCQTAPGEGVPGASRSMVGPSGDVAPRQVADSRSGKGRSGGGPAANLSAGNGAGSGAAAGKQAGSEDSTTGDVPAETKGGGDAPPGDRGGKSGGSAASGRGKDVMEVERGVGAVAGTTRTRTGEPLGSPDATAAARAAGSPALATASQANPSGGGASASDTARSSGCHANGGNAVDANNSIGSVGNAAASLRASSPHGNSNAATINNTSALPGASCPRGNTAITIATNNNDNSPPSSSPVATSPHENNDTAIDNNHNHNNLPSSPGATSPSAGGCSTLSTSSLCQMTPVATAARVRLDGPWTCAGVPSLAGLWKGMYGLHGLEMVHVAYSGGRIKATKLIGDPNVPAGQVSWIVDPDTVCASPPRDAREDAFMQLLQRQAGGQFQVSHSVLGLGTIAGHGYVHPQRLPGRLFVETDGHLAFLWEDHMNFVIRFTRVDLGELQLAVV
eukprot:jgi/Mesvir1/20594/Mv14829-RA.1